MSNRCISLPAQDLPLPGALRVEDSSLHAGVGWSLSGNIVFAASQWGILSALAYFGGAVAVGQFSLGLAIATPILTFTNLQLRAIVATDATNRRSFPDYLRLRSATTLLALSAMIAVLLCTPYRGVTFWMIVCVALAKAIDSCSDIHYGLFQQQERFRSVAVSLMLRGTLGTALLAAVIYTTGNASFAVAALAAAWLAVLLLHDVPSGRTFAPSTGALLPAPKSFFLSRRDLLFLRTVLPLGFVSALISLQTNVPRYFIQWHSGESALGIFSAIAYLGTLLTVFIDALGAAAMPRLARHFAAGRISDFRGLVARLSALACMAGLLGVIAAAAIGPLVLRIAYGKEFVPYRELFVWLMAATAVTCLGTVLTCALTAAGRLRVQVPLFFTAVATASLGCAILIPKAGSIGAAWAMLTAATVHAVLTLALVAHSCRPSPAPHRIP